MDVTRPSTMAMVSMCGMDEEITHISDVDSYNHYFSWYGDDGDRRIQRYVISPSESKTPGRKLPGIFLSLHIFHQKTLFNPSKLSIRILVVITSISSPSMIQYHKILWR